MIHDATVEVTCDRADGCHASIAIQPEFVYRDCSGKNGYYDTSDSAIEQKVEGAEWIVRDGKHYCSKECAEIGEEK